VLESYEVLAEFPFSPITRKQGILVRHRKTDKIIYFVKGAEVVLEKAIHKSQRPLLLKFCEDLAQ
jgi:phospholipid-translocating ATPase